MPFDPISLGIGAGSLLTGLFGQKSSGLGKEFFNISNNQTAYDRSKQFANPNSSLYRDASKGFYNRLTNAVPSGASLLQTLAAQGINSPTVANLQRQAALKKAGTEASDYESDLFGNFQGIGANYLQQYYNNQQYSKSAYANQRNIDVSSNNDLFGNFSDFGGGLLGYLLGQGGGGGTGSFNVSTPSFKSSANLYPDLKVRGLQG